MSIHVAMEIEVTINDQAIRLTAAEARSLLDQLRTALGEDRMSPAPVRVPIITPWQETWTLPCTPWTYHLDTSADSGAFLPHGTCRDREAHQ